MLSTRLENFSSLLLSDQSLHIFAYPDIAKLNRVAMELQVERFLFWM